MLNLGLTGTISTCRLPLDDPLIHLLVDVRELATVYLGGSSLSSLVNAGLVQEVTPGAAQAASTAFSSTLAPMLPWDF